VRHGRKPNLNGKIFMGHGAGGGSRTLTGLLSPADFLTAYGFRRPDTT